MRGIASFFSSVVPKEVAVNFIFLVARNFLWLFFPKRCPCKCVLIAKADFSFCLDRPVGIKSPPCCFEMVAVPLFLCDTPLPASLGTRGGVWY